MVEAFCLFFFFFFFSLRIFTFLIISKCPILAVAMVVQLFGLTVSSGMPLFVRKKGDKDPVSFSHIASANGAFMFAKSHGITLNHVKMQDGVFAWKEFNDSIMLIGMATGVTVPMLEQFLESVYNAMILTVGIDELTNLKNVERLKRELRVSYRLIDKLLDGLECSDKGHSIRSHSTPFRGDVDDFVEIILVQESETLANCLESYMDVVESAYGCICIHGKVAVATPSWWELSACEKRLLSLMVAASNANCSATDVPVFLPIKSPSVPFRLVSLRLLGGIDVCALCGPSPSLSEMEQAALQVWRPVVDVLRSAEKTYPRNFPASIALDNNVLGVLLINLTVGKFLVSRNMSSTESCSLSGSHRLNVLRAFYAESASMLKDDGKVNETYWCSEYHKCHAMRQGDNLICVLYAASVPSHTMRLLTKQSLASLAGEKGIPW